MGSAVLASSCKSVQHIRDEDGCGFVIRVGCGQGSGRGQGREIVDREMKPWLEKWVWSRHG